MNKFNEIIELLKNRRVVSAIISLVIVGLAAFGVTVAIEADKTAEMIGALAVAVGNLVSAGLDIWSYLKPKAN